MLDVTEQKPNQALKALVAMLGKEAKECGLPIIGKFLKDRQAQIKFYKPYNQLGFFCVNNGTPIELINTYVTCCYNVAIGPSILVQRTQCQKGLIMYFKVNGIMAIKKHIDVDICQSNSKIV